MCVCQCVCLPVCIIVFLRVCVCVCVSVKVQSISQSFSGITEKNLTPSPSPTPAPPLCKRHRVSCCYSYWKYANLKLLIIVNHFDLFAFIFQSLPIPASVLDRSSSTQTATALSLSWRTAVKWRVTSRSCLKPIMWVNWTAVICPCDVSQHCSFGLLTSFSVQ